MNIEYTLEQINSADYVVVLTLDSNGFREERVKILKITPKKVTLEKHVDSRGALRKELYHDEIGGNIEHLSAVVGKRNADTFYISKTVVILEEDIDRAKEVILELANHRYHRYIEQLNNQHAILESLRSEFSSVK